jgi:sigma-B regulation protein RsbU (phosphoserine phosphatase)
MYPLSIMLLRQRVRDAWARRSRLTAFIVYLSCIELLLTGAHYGLRAFDKSAEGPIAWIYFVGAVLGGAVFALAFRWFRRVVMWRLRNRLIVTYVFIGVIPVVLLLAIGVIAGYLFAGQFAIFVVTSDIDTQLKSLEAANRTAAASLATQVAAGVPTEIAIRTIRLDSPHRGMTVWTEAPAGKSTASVAPTWAPEVSPPPKSQPASFAAVVGDENGVYLRAWTSVSAPTKKLTVIATEPLDKELLGHMAADLGEVRLNPPTFRRSQEPSKPEAADATGYPAASSSSQPGQAQSHSHQGRGGTVINSQDGSVQVRMPESAEPVRTLPGIAAGTLIAPQGRWDPEVLFGMPFHAINWYNGENTAILERGAQGTLVVHSRLSLLYRRLFKALGDLAGYISILLAAVAIFFALIELVALITGIRLTRTMTRSVAALYGATQHINRGDLRHRIKVRTQDQLAALETSFNSMTESLQKLIAEQKEKQRMESELAIAQEVQAQLFPRELSQLASLEVHGLCRPARTVSGDYYDFLTLGPEKLGIAVGDISGKGISAALLMATIHSAVRVYEFGRMPSREELVAAGAAALSTAQGSHSVIAAGAIQSPAAVLELLNSHLYHSTPPEKYATLFLGLWDGTARRLTYSNGGHLPPLVISNDGFVRKLQDGGTVIGLFDNMQWDEGIVELRHGDLFIAYSDGITEPENEFGEFGEKRLIEQVLENRHLPLARITEVVISAVLDWIGTAEQPDDLTLVLARAT